MRSGIPHPREEPIALDDGLHGDSRRARCGVSAESVAGERAAIGGLEHGCDPVRKDGRTEGQVAPREALRDCHDVGHDTILLERTPGAGAPCATHDLIRDEEHAVAGADLAHPLYVARWRRHGATGRTD